MSIIHSIKPALLNANESKEKILMGFLDLDIKSENTFVYMGNNERELVISSGEIKLYKSIRIENKIVTVSFTEPIKPYGKTNLLSEFSVNLRNKDDDIIVFPSNHTIKELFSEMINLKEHDKKVELKKKEHKLIFNPILANFLILEGFRVIDTKKDRKNPNNWIPIFLVDDGFNEAIDRFERLEKYKKKK